MVLTDGKTWSFYLPAEQGSYEDRRVYMLDIFGREPAVAAADLARYLAKPKVEAGEALETARQEYRNRNRRAQARSAIPAAWKELVERGEESLVELLANAVESKEGIRPEEDDVIAFLASLTASGANPSVRKFLPSQSHLVASASPARLSPSADESAAARSGELVLRGKVFRYANAKEAMVIVLRELAKEDPTFLERCACHPDAQGRKRRYIARTPEELYPGRADLHELREVLPGGWFVATNLNNATKKSIIRLAADVAGLSFGKDIVVEF